SASNSPAGTPSSTALLAAAAEARSPAAAPGRYDAVHMSLFHSAIVNMTSFMGVGGDSSLVVESALNSTSVAPYLLDQLLALNHQDNLGEFVSAFVDYARVHQGVRAVTANFWPQILASNLASLLGIVEIGNRVDHLEAGIETIELRKQLETLSDSSRMPVTASIDALQRMQWVLDLVNQNPQSFSNRIQAALAWPVIISDDYINALYLRHPEALAVLAFFLAFVYENRSYWVFEPCAGSLIEALANHLGPFWKEGLSWPLSKIAGS
ncbi:hypothetical protein H9L39_18364, partial [Fusarium oxysporum f. sp. albedinis]